MLRVEVAGTLLFLLPTILTALLKEPPAELIAGFTMRLFDASSFASFITTIRFSGAVPLEYFLVDDTNKSFGTHFTYTDSEIAAMIASARKLRERFEVSLQLKPRDVVLKQVRCDS